MEWYLIYTKPRNEDLVSTLLREAGFEVLNPKLRERKYVRRKLQDVVSPLFPSYVFVRFNVPGDYRVVRYTRGVRRVVGTDSTPAVVPEHIMAALIERTKDGPVEIKPSELEPGEEVSIKGGPFEGLNAVFERRLHHSERVCILLKELNARVVIDRGFLARTGS